MGKISMRCHHGRGSSAIIIITLALVGIYVVYTGSAYFLPYTQPSTTHVRPSHLPGYYGDRALGLVQDQVDSSKPEDGGRGRGVEKGGVGERREEGKDRGFGDGEGREEGAGEIKGGRGEGGGRGRGGGIEEDREGGVVKGGGGEGDGRGGEGRVKGEVGGREGGREGERDDGREGEGREEERRGALLLQHVVFIVLSQPHPFHHQRALQWEKDLRHQSQQDHLGVPLTILLHVRWPHDNATLVYPILPEMLDLYGNKRWIFFCEEETRIKPKSLLNVLAHYNHKKDLLLGAPLQDNLPSVRHEYIQPKQLFLYPDFAAGFAISLALVKSMTKRLINGTSALPDKHSHDRQFEFAWLSYISTTAVPEFCVGPEHENCVTTNTVNFPHCNEIVPLKSLYVAVKVCEKFKDRVPMMQQTWGRHVTDKELYSDVSIPGVKTINVGYEKTGPSGGCGRMLKILQRFATSPQWTKKNWLFIADDNTFVSIKRLQSLLSCYESDGPVVVGRRYGMNVGYRDPKLILYPTGGAGIVLNRAAVEIMLNSDWLFCPSQSYPDDVALGKWLNLAKISITSSPLFHQALPRDYPASYLKHQLPVTFHPWNKLPAAINATDLAEMFKRWL